MGQTMSSMLLLPKIGPWDVCSLVWLTCPATTTTPSHPCPATLQVTAAVPGAHVGFSSVVLCVEIPSPRGKPELIARQSPVK